MGFLTLDAEGVILAFAMGLFFVGFGGSLWWFFLGVMLLFLVLSAIVTRAGIDHKKKMGQGQKPRNMNNVLANGIVPLSLVLLYRLALVLGAQHYAFLFIVGFVASVTSITADKFASELGMLDGKPFMLVGMKAVKKGTSGAVTLPGLGASVLGAFVVGLAAFALGPGYIVHGTAAALVVILVVSGFVGDIVDSFAGYYEEKGVGNKYTSNVLCSIAGAAMAIAVVALVL
jgi:uncharacterized protein (TIGR00297 family)